jgi:superfamily I DNA/RNA helicase
MVFVPLVNGYVKPRYDMVVVDEAQDMNAAQLALAQRCVKKGGRVCVVGDDRQAIYGFRGADSNGIDRLKTELQAVELGLTVTYRCGKSIVEVARALVPDFTAHEGNAAGIVDAVGLSAIFDAAQPGDFILSRKNAPLLPLCLGFLKRGIRARIEGRDLGKMLRGIVAGFKARSVPEYLGKVGKWGEKASKRANKITREDIRTAKLDEVRDQVEVLTAIAEGCANVEAILLRCDTLFGDSSETGRAPEVVLSSVHKSKGLEARRVFVLQSTVSTRSVEEANIYYVAVTRAINQLSWLVGEAA